MCADVESDLVTVQMWRTTDEGLVEYAPGQPEATVEQMAYDVSVFLTWTAEPTLEDRKKLGFQVMIYLIIFCGIMFFAYRRIARRILGH